MHQVISSDGTAIAYEQSGTGPAVILIGGAFSYRAFPKTRQLAELLSQHFTVINYDRRGRGDSGDTLPYSVDREIDDLEALIEAAGGSASLWGWSSGAVLALRAAGRGLPVRSLALYEPPFLVDDSRPVPPADFSPRLERLLAADDRAGAVKHFMTQAMGVPAFFVAGLRLTPMWGRLKAVAHTLPYDWALLEGNMHGEPLDAGEWASVTAPTLVMAGEKTPQQLRNAAAALADVLTDAQLKILKGESHNPSMKVQAPVIASFIREHARERLAA